MDLNLTMTEEEFCRFLGVSRTTLWRLRRAGKLSYYRVGDKVLYSAQHAEEFLVNCERRSRSKRVKNDCSMS